MNQELLNKTLYKKTEKAIFDCSDIGNLRNLLEQGADPNYDPGYYPEFRDLTINIATNNNRTQITKLLLEYGADVNNKSYDGSTPLHNACKFDNYSMAQLLLSYGADPTIRDSKGQTPLDLATPEMTNFIQHFIQERNEAITRVTQRLPESVISLIKGYSRYGKHRKRRRRSRKKAPKNF